MNEKSFCSRSVADRADFDDRRAEALIFAVFQNLRDRLIPSEATKVLVTAGSALNNRLYL